MMNSLAARAAPQARVFFKENVIRWCHDVLPQGGATTECWWQSYVAWTESVVKPDAWLTEVWFDAEHFLENTLLKSVLFWWFVNLCFSDLTRRFVDRGLLPGSLFGSTGPARGIRNRNGDPGDTGNLRRSHTQLHQNRALEASTTTGALEMHVFHFNMFHFF